MHRSSSKEGVRQSSGGATPPKARSIPDEIMRYAPPEKDKPAYRSLRQQQRLLAFYISLVLLPTSLIYIHSRGLLTSVTGGEKGVLYEIVIDGGSSGSRAHVFRYSFSPGSTLPDLHFPDSELKTTPGLSSFASHPSDAGESLLPLLEFAVSKIPSWAHRRTRLTLYATAGLRLLRPSTAEAILESCRVVLSRGPFLFQPEWASMLSGTYEGLYGWVAANYGAGELEVMAQQIRAPTNMRQQGLGVVELGGASAQVTFVTDSASAGVGAMTTNLQIGKDTQILSMFTHSFLGVGQEAAQEAALQLIGTDHWQREWRSARRDSDPTEEIAVKLDPCYPPGWVADDGRLGHGNFSMCRRVAGELLASDACQGSSGRCLAGSTIPTWEGPILAIENFFYTAQMLGLPAQATVQEFATAGERYCSTSWEELQRKYRGKKTVTELLKYCFSTAHIVSLLVDGLGVDPTEQRVTFSNTVHSASGQGVNVDWAMGHVVVSAAGRGTITPVQQPRIAARLELIAAVTVAICAALVLYRQARGRVPSMSRSASRGGLRAYYDLERGGYRYLK